MVHTRRREQKYINEFEIERLKEACDVFSDQLIVYGLLYSGMRVNELCHMRQTWIDLRKGTITIPRQDGDWHPKIVHVWDNEKNQPKKTYCSNRVIPVLNKTLLDILSRLVEYNYCLNDHMNRKDVWMRLNRLWKKTGAKDRISPHVLRHTCLSLMIWKDYSVTDVAAQAGHHTIDVTIRTYIHPDNVHLIKAVQEKGGI